MKKLMIPAIVALMSVGALAEDAAKPAEGAAAPAAAGGDCKVVLKADDIRPERIQNQQSRLPGIHRRA